MNIGVQTQVWTFAGAGLQPAP